MTTTATKMTTLNTTEVLHSNTTTKITFATTTTIITVFPASTSAAAASHRTLYHLLWPSFS